jgi:hypothetical protein
VGEFTAQGGPSASVMPSGSNLYIVEEQRSGTAQAPRIWI